MAIKDGYHTVKHPVLGTIVEAQAPLATYLSDESDFDLALYPDGEVGMLMRLELDWPSRFQPGQLIEITKDVVVGKEYLSRYGRGAFINKFEEVFDNVAEEQLEFVDIQKRIEIRNNIATLLHEFFSRLDRGDFDKDFAH